MSAIHEPAIVGECDTPTCRREAKEFTPRGFVCVRCANAIEREYRDAERRDTKLGRRAGQ